MPANAKTLSEMKDELYRTFNKAMDAHDSTYNADERKAASDRAQDSAKTIAMLEHQIAVLDFFKAVREEGGSIAFETGPDGTTKISVLNPIRLKGSANAP